MAGPDGDQLLGNDSHDNMYIIVAKIRPAITNIWNLRCLV